MLSQHKATKMYNMAADNLTSTYSIFQRLIFDVQYCLFPLNLKRESKNVNDLPLTRGH